MSTFGGVMEEFPNVRVDFFRPIRPKAGETPLPPALACFLSHVHTDHLEGLETLSFKGPFIYCSAATRELLLRLEKYPHRLNFVKGILEARRVVFKHLEKLLKPIPLETPTRIKLSPGNEIQVTLFDANHCAGAVMFLFEGNGKAALYTGDIRSEPWFVNKLTRNPFLIEYTSGLKSLDCIYLDTSNIDPISFPTKAAGLQELLDKVSKYPPGTIFHFEAWTFGYEEVWMALSKALKSPIHVDTYKWRLYQSLRGDSESTNKHSGPFLAHEGPVLTGYTCGNTWQDGCLTKDTGVRLHSCEKGMQCSTVNEKTVFIRPIITRAGGEELQELGVGGGGGDLVQHPDLVFDANEGPALMDLFSDVSDAVRNEINRIFLTGLRPTGKAIPLDGMGFDRDEDELPLTEMAKKMAQSMIEKRRGSISSDTICYNGQDLPKSITFPYSRHSSYEELCDLVRIFQPKDVYPCTVDEEIWYKERITIDHLFGHQCSSKKFRYDCQMREKYPDFSQSQSQNQHTQVTFSQSSQMSDSQDLLQQRPAAEEPANKGLTVLKRDALGRLRLFPAQGQSAITTSETISKNVTPPRQIIAVSPGSDSQSLRRKAIFDELGENAKRPRLHLDSSTSSNHGTAELSYVARVQRPEVPSIDLSGSSDRQDTPGSEADSTKSSNSVASSDLDIPGDSDEAPNLFAVFDPTDEVLRCKACWSEVWGGCCTGCDDGPNEATYYEEPDAENERRRPDIAQDEYSDEILDDQDRLELVGDYLDDEESAYDSQDSVGLGFLEEYEINSFIDDAFSENDEESSSDGEEDYKTRYEELQASYAALIADRNRLANDYLDFRMDVLGSDFDEDENDDEQFDEDGLLIVQLARPEVVTTEVVLSEAEEEQLSRSSLVTVLSIRESSQTPSPSADRVGRIQEAFDAVENGSNGRGWHDVSLVSTSNNHTHREMEL